MSGGTDRLVRSLEEVGSGIDRIKSERDALLAALRTYVAYDERINGPDGDPDTDRLLVARAAIAKAEGREP